MIKGKRPPRYNQEASLMARRLDEAARRQLAQTLFPAAVSIIKGETTNFKLKGSSKEMLSAINNAVGASRDFYNEVRNPDATMETVTEKLQKKHHFAQKFEKIIGMPWPL
jgi:HD superfamily phosphodiesterase